MAKLTDDQLRFIIDIEANGAQGQINSLSAEIGKLEKQNASLSSSISKVNNELEKQEKKLAKLEKAFRVLLLLLVDHFMIPIIPINANFRFLKLYKNTEITKFFV